MNPAIRGGFTLLICLLAVFPCGAALTVLGTLTAEAVRTVAAHGPIMEKLRGLGLSALWAGGGVAGFISLIYGVDKLMEAQRRLPWYALLSILIGIGAAGFFSLSYPLHTRSALFLRIVCVAPVAIESLLLLFHLVRFLRPHPLQSVTLTPAMDTASSSSASFSRKI